MSRLFQEAGDTLDIMIVREGVEIEPAIDALRPELTVEGIGDFKVVAVIVARPEPLVELIVSRGRKATRADPAVVITVYHLTPEPEIGTQPPTVRTEVALKVKIEAV